MILFIANCVFIPMAKAKFKKEAYIIVGTIVYHLIAIQFETQFEGKPDQLRTVHCRTC